MKRIFTNEFKRFLPVYLIILSLVILLGTSYALLRDSKTGTKSYTMNVAGLEITFKDKSSIDVLSLENAVPISDEEGIEGSSELVFTIKNTGNVKASYDIYIEETSTNPEFKSVIRYIDKKGTGEYTTPKTLGDNKYIDQNGTIDVNGEIEYRVKCWLDESADNTYMNQTFKARIVVDAKQFVMKKNEIISKVSDTINDSDGIKFYKVSGTHNGNGLFVLKGTESDEHPIYFYRGNVDNNNVYFAESCWKIVRTTETGGTKLVYNGAATIVDGEKQCNQTTGTGTQLSVRTKAFNSSYNSPAYVGYSLPESSKIYPYSTQTLNSTTYYGSSVDQATKRLVDPVLELNDTHHYSYNSTDPDATGISGDTGNVRYYYYKNSASGTSGTGYFIKFDKTKSVSTILDEMLTESNSKNNPSTIQGVINTWWGIGDNSLNSKYGEYLEDTEWCNDRSVASLGGWSPTGTLYSSNLEDYSIVFNEKVRYDQSTYGSDANNIKNTNTPVLSCSRPVDRLTVANGNLTYPIGLLTYDEVAMAGAIWSNENSDFYLKFYLYTNQSYWLLSPARFSGYADVVGTVTNVGYLKFYSVYSDDQGVRPALSLKNGTQILRGEGTKTKPYIITED